VDASRNKIIAFPRNTKNHFGFYINLFGEQFV